MCYFIPFVPYGCVFWESMICHTDVLISGGTGMTVVYATLFNSHPSVRTFVNDVTLCAYEYGYKV